MSAAPETSPPTTVTGGLTGRIVSLAKYGIVTAVNTAQAVDKRFDVSGKTVAVYGVVEKKVVAIDEKYKIAQTVMKQSIVKSAVAKVQELDSKYSVSDTVKARLQALLSELKVILDESKK